MNWNIAITPSTPYHFGFRTLPRHRWYGPLLVLLLFGIFYSGAMVLLLLGPALFTTIAEALGGPPAPAWDTAAVTAFGDLFAVALLWPAVELATFCVYRRWFFTLFSVGRGLRWPLLGRYLLVSAAVWAVGIAVCAVLVSTSVLSWDLGTRDLPLGVLLALLVLLVPPAAVGQEVVFRGLAFNVVGSWVRSPVWAVLAPLPIMAIGTYTTVPGLLAVAVFGILMGVLVFATGGLEAGIAANVVTQGCVIGFSLGFGVEIAPPHTPPVVVIMTLVGALALTGYVLVEKRRRGIASSTSGSRRTRTDRQRYSGRAPRVVGK